MAAKTHNPIDDNRQGLIGKGLNRVDGPLKVSGQAPYSYEFQVEGKIAYGYIVGAAIPRGRLLKLDTTNAENAPGVVLVLTHKNAPVQGEFGPAQPENSSMDRPKPFLNRTDIRYYGEPIAFVVANSYEAARNAAAMVNAEYSEEKTPRLSLKAETKNAYRPEKEGFGGPMDSSIGNFSTAFQNAPVQVDVTYTTPYQHHMAMEPHASLAIWEDDRLTIYSSQQLPVSCHETLAKTLLVPKENIRLICKYIGGGFGSKLYTEADAILSSLAARMLKRPVKIAQTRQQLFANTVHRGESLQRIRLGAELNGKLTAIGHDVWTQTASFDENVEQAASQTRSMYAAPNRLTTHRAVILDLPPSGAMRAPGEAMGMLALEQGMDELAVKLNMDPVELRIVNDTQEDPEKKIPFSSRALERCLREGAQRFGWDKRPKKPGELCDGDWLIGYGMAAAIRSNFIQESEARVVLTRDGKLRVEMAMTDIGTGTYTILTQIAAEAMSVPIEDVTVDIGDTNLPPTPGSGGSFGANSTGSALYDACMKLREQLVSLAISQADSPLYALAANSAEIDKGQVHIGGKSDSYAAIVARTSTQQVVVKGKITPPESYQKYAQAAFGGNFVEVGVHALTGEIRLRRMLGVFAAGRILNQKTAHSQLIGGMIWGVGAALLEGTIVDQRYGHYVNHDFAEYHVAVHADTPNIEAYFLPEEDDKTGPLKIKGVGELSICGAGAAVANAVFNACGVRVRDYPITLDKIISDLEEA